MTMCVELYGVVGYGRDKGMLAYNYVHVQGVRDKGACFCGCCMLRLYGVSFIEGLT